jgi:hypothetical protein
MFMLQVAHVYAAESKPQVGLNDKSASTIADKLHFLLVFITLATSRYEQRHDKTNIMGLRPAWIQTSLRIRAV